MCGSRSWIYLVITYSFGALNLFFILTAETGNTLFHFLVTFFSPVISIVCLFLSGAAASQSGLFSQCAHLKVTGSQLHEVIHHATTKARLKQQPEHRRTCI